MTWIGFEPRVYRQYTVELVSLQSAYFDVEPDEQLGSGIQKERGAQNAVSSLSVEITTLYRQDEPVPVPYTERP